MEVLYEVRGRNLLIYLPEELDHHNAKIIQSSRTGILFQTKFKTLFLILKEQNLWTVQESGLLWDGIS